MNTDLTRRLAAILSADVEGYSRLMREDEEATVRTITTHRTAMTRLIQQYRGRVVDSPGDNILAEFTSVVDVVNCGVEIQRELAERNAELPENRRMEFRIGINLGDVLEEGERIYGEGVNIAARMESLAEAGGICISGTVYDAVESKIGLEYDYLGEHKVKNIDKPIRAYKVLSYPGAAAHRVVKAKKAIGKAWRNSLIALISLLIVATAVGIWHFYFRPQPIEPASVNKMAYPLPDKPSIAVLPFTNMTGDPSQEFLPDGITDNIITVLSAVPQLFIIARHSTFGYKGKPVKVRKVAEDLGVRYILEGSVSRSGDRIRVTAQLIDALKGHHLWAERYDRELKDLFLLQDDLARRILRGIGLKLTIGEEVLRGRRPKNMEVSLKLLQGTEYLRAFNIDGNNRARLIAEECMALEPDYWGNYWFLGSVHMMDFYLGSTRDPAKSLLTAIGYLEKAVALSDDSKGRVYPQLGFLYAMKKDYGKAIEFGEKAIAIVPNGADAHAWLAMSLTFAGRAQEALPLFEKAMRLNPLPPAFYYLNFGHAYRLLGRFEEAVTMYGKTTALTPNNIMAYISLAGTYGLMGKEEEAKAAGAKVLRINPKWSIEYYVKTSVSKDKDRLIEGLRKAGMPEHAPLPIPDKPSIAVLPFVNMSSDSEQEYFSDGITEAIITALSKVEKLFVISRNSTFTYKGKSVKVQQVAKDLGVKYILEGSVQRSANRIRVTAQLIDARKGQHVWAERYDRDLKDLFNLQDEITIKIITALEVKLTEGEQALVAGSGTDNLDAYLKILQARDLKRNQNIENNYKARRLAEEAIKLDPNYAQAYRWLSGTHLMDVWLGSTKSPQESLRTAMELAKKALSLDDTLGGAHGLLGNIYIMRNEYEKGIREAERAVELEPNGADAHAFLGMGLRFADRAEEAVPILQKAIRLDPHAPDWYLNVLAGAYRDLEKYEAAIQWGEKAVRRNPKNALSRVNLCSIYSLAGRMDEAHAQAKEIMRLNPNISLEGIARTDPQKNQVTKKRYLDALRKAGLK